MHSDPFMVNAVLFVKVIFSVKTADNPGPCWSAPIPVPPHLPSLSNSVFLVCFHIPSLPPSLTVAFMLSPLLFFTLSSICQPFISLLVHLLRSHLCLRRSAYQLLTVSFVSLLTFSALPSAHLQTLALPTPPFNHMAVILLSRSLSHVTFREKRLLKGLSTAVGFNQPHRLSAWEKLH